MRTCAGGQGEDDVVPADQYPPERGTAARALTTTGVVSEGPRSLTQAQPSHRSQWGGR
ncbi:hypothetical protein ACFYO0_11840 [Streptomyces sp. NPDC006365]|uniref:hypothetical protein n=1 Tax=Streptomyces sp. NPDC006365 TaxID=3364744 RepID=UPI0036CECA6A